jgi:hypothetical protein
LLGIVSLVFISSSGFAQTTLVPVASTPYDRQMSRVFPVLNSKSTPAAMAVAIPLPITVWMVELRALPYHYSKHWQTPAELRLAQESDCKGKSLALYEEMRKGGARNLRIVIGKRHIFDASTHTWVQWDANGESYVLDPTFNESPMRAALLDPSTYVPFYAFDGEHKYRAMNPALMANAPSIPKPQMQSVPAPAMGSYRPANTTTAARRTTAPVVTTKVVAAPTTVNHLTSSTAQQPARSTTSIAPKSYITTPVTQPSLTTNSSPGVNSKNVNSPVPVAIAAAQPKTTAHKSSSTKSNSSSHATHHHRRHHRNHTMAASG